MRGEDLPLRYRVLLATYPWRRIEPVPRAVLDGPLAQSRVALVTTAGLVRAGDVPFDLARRGGDPSFRLIPHRTPFGSLAIHHRSDAFDRAALRDDPNVVFPRDVLDGAVRTGHIGDVAPRHLSFMGSITAPARLVGEYAPLAGERLKADGVDVALLVPV